MRSPSRWPCPPSLPGGRRAAGGLAATDLVLEEGAALPLPPLAPTRYEVARSKGGPKPGLIFAGGGFFTLGLRGFGAAPEVRLGVRKEVGPVGVRLRLDYGGKSTRDPVLGRYDLTYVGGALAALYPLNEARVLIEAGPELGYGYASQRLSGSGRGFGIERCVGGRRGHGDLANRTNSAGCRRWSRGGGVQARRPRDSSAGGFALPPSPVGILTWACIDQPPGLLCSSPSPVSRPWSMETPRRNC